LHLVGKVSECRADNGVYDTHSTGLTRLPLVGTESPHQSLTVVELAAGGCVARHLQAYEEALYVLEGVVAIELPTGTEQLAADDYCFIEVGVAHALQQRGKGKARWLELAAPHPGSDMIADTVFPPDEAAFEIPEPSFRRGHFESSQLPPPSSALGLPGFGEANVGGASVRIVVERDFGASQFNLMVIEYGPGGFIADHDHAFEEAFLFLSGEIEAVLDGETYELQAGDYCWSGVRSRQAFTNRSERPVRWLETQAPQPPSRHQARFKPDWERLIARTAAT
jgi:quercetin dioxygenase-like cupin family protein